MSDFGRTLEQRNTARLLQRWKEARSSSSGFDVDALRRGGRWQPARRSVGLSTGMDELRQRLELKPAPPDRHPIQPKPAARPVDDPGRRDQPLPGRSPVERVDDCPVTVCVRPDGCLRCDHRLPPCLGQCKERLYMAALPFVVRRPEHPSSPRDAASPPVAVRMTATSPGGFVATTQP